MAQGQSTKGRSTRSSSQNRGQRSGQNLTGAQVRQNMKGKYHGATTGILTTMQLLGASQRNTVLKELGPAFHAMGFPWPAPYGQQGISGPSTRTGQQRGGTRTASRRRTQQRSQAVNA